MPHIEVKCFPGRTLEQKEALAKRIVDALVEEFDTKESSISIMIKEVDPKDWDTVVEKEIKPQYDLLAIKPGYIK